jgi:hypothetical protein
MGASLPVERMWVDASLRPPQASSAVLFADFYRRWPDPAYAAGALSILPSVAVTGDPASVALAQRLLEQSADDASWHVNLAGNQLLTAQVLEKNDPSRFATFASIAEKGATADPASGLWYTFAAIEADRLALTDKAAEYAQRALAFPMDVETRAQVKRLAGE